VTIYDKREVVFVNVITNTIINMVDIGHECWGTDFNMNRLAIRAIQNTTSYIVGIPEKRTMFFSQFPFLENINNRLSVSSTNTSLPSGNMSQPVIQRRPLFLA
jgi:hypothetical protein